MSEVTRNDRAHFNLGNALRDKGDAAGAIAAYRKAIEVNTTFAEAHESLGLVLKLHPELTKDAEEIPSSHQKR